MNLLAPHSQWASVIMLMAGLLLVYFVLVWAMNPPYGDDDGWWND